MAVLDADLVHRWFDRLRRQDLELECREPLPPAQPASCGALPGENRGTAFLAEITCTMQVADEVLPTLIGELNRLCREVAIWPTDRSSSLHLHTDRPGEAIEQLYASGMPFDLQITRFDESATRST